jgi:cephalosporin-C deacetylase-like acetyl esterase
MRTVLLLTLVLACSATVFGQAPAPPRFEDLVKQFDYDAKAPLDVKEVGRERREGASVIDLTYASPRGGRVPAYLVVPDGRGPFAAVLFGHWMMRGSPFRNRREFLEEAVVLARAGAVSLLTDAPYVRPGFVMETDEAREPEQSSEVARQQAVDFRRGLDMLLARRDVDKKRVAFVGHSFNAHVGAILAGVEKRIGSFVLMANTYADEEYVFDPENEQMLALRKKWGDEALRKYFRDYAWDDPVYFVARAAPAAVFLQYGRRDKQTPEKVARRDFARFGEPKRIGFYDAGHELDSVARRERVEWLAGRLSLRRVDFDALARIPPLK